MVKDKFEMIDPIGGYFGLELPPKIENYIHEGGIHLNSGRNALEYILRGISNIKCLWIPYYTCDVVLEPIKKLNILYRFYSISDCFELIKNIELEENDYLLVTNYFGIKDSYINELSSRYGRHLIVDNAQAFYTMPLKGVKTIYSPRKFVGVPDGGIAYTTENSNKMEIDYDISYDKCSHLLKRLDLGAELGYADFRENSIQLVNQPIKKMSNLTWRILQSINFSLVKKRRRENFKRLHNVLSSVNQLYISDMDTFACPMVYPFYTSDSTLKKRLIKNKIFVATYWPNVLEWCKPFDVEYKLADHIIAIPIDQRYGTEEMDYILKIIESNE